jgi:N utilization substance protein A
LVSRSHRNLLRRLFELEIPEIYGGTIDIKSIAREPGYRSKVAVAARQEGVDPVGCCVGLRGIRIQNIVNELRGEKIDVVEWSEDPATFIANALSPAQVSNVELNQAENTAIVAVPDKQLSLAIGKEGQNARLAAKLTGWRIDIKSASIIEAEKASIVREAVAAGRGAVSEAEELVSEFMAEEEAIGPAAEGEEEIAGEAETVTEEKAEEVTVSASDFDLVLAGGVPSAAKSGEPKQIRFAEDILPGRASKAKRKKAGKKDSDAVASKSKPKKGRQKRLDYEEELE